MLVCKLILIYFNKNNQIGIILYVFFNLCFSSNNFKLQRVLNTQSPMTKVNVGGFLKKKKRFGFF